MKPVNLPIFPLKLVVLPGTIQGLQIFEPRYLNMVKQCMSSASNFVISYKSDKSDDFQLAIEAIYQPSAVIVAVETVVKVTPAAPKYVPPVAVNRLLNAMLP